ncbi:MAG: bifunctional isocitrate dehydrogenase kinase/phosphatase [Desulfobacterales bacterium]|nr:bifunctional isocitrate dehydrogenase kinase/phosphatase [Desulfobacterales bacterium]
MTERIFGGYLSYRKAFGRITRSAPARFHQRDWVGAHEDVIKRIEVYKSRVEHCVKALLALLEHEGLRPRTDPALKRRYLEKIRLRDDEELAKTFYNSVIRRVLETVGVDPAAEFVDADFRDPLQAASAGKSTLAFPMKGTIREALKEVIEQYRRELSLSDPESDVDLLSAAVNTRISTRAAGSRIRGIETLKPVFYHNKAAYIIGRILLEKTSIPLVLPICSDERGIYVDAVLMTEVEVSILFSFTRTYFRVEVETASPSSIIRFLKELMPKKPVSELYTAIGFHKHGKAELFRELQRHLAGTREKFHLAPGERGMVMAVFTMPSFDVVFKVIRDRFEYPKSTNPRHVKDRYGLVFRHDRAGRLVEAQEFEHLQIDRRRFSEDLLSFLGRNARRYVKIESDWVELRHVYTERQIVPLDVYLQQADSGTAREAVRDYGNAIKELAYTNIFPGDLFMKNFGLTRHGRVVFYDYDELCLLTDCRFRRIPEAREPESELAREPWFFVDENDVFPEEFPSFIGLPEPLMAIFEKEHGELFTVDFWKQVQADLKAGKLFNLFPYPESCRLPRFPAERQSRPPWKKMRNPL